MALNLLLVDDNPRIRQLLRTILSELDDVTVREASDGGGAIEACAAWKPDIAIVDCEMSPMGGLEFIEQVRAGATRAPANLPIIMMTGHAELQRVMRARRAGVSGFIAKPLSVGAVLGRLQRTLSASADQKPGDRAAPSTDVLLSGC